MRKVTMGQLIWSGMKLNFLQVAWNFERLQNTGFLFSIYNILARIYKGRREQLLLAVKRHLNFFNTHIFFSSAVLGVIARLEEEISDDDPEKKETEIENTKMGIMGPLAAIGDSLFWSGIKPFALLCGAGILYLDGFTVKSWIIAASVSLLVYNVPKIIIKYFLLLKAYYNFQELFVLIQKVKFQDIMKSIKIVGMGLLGGIMAGFLMKKEPSFGIPTILDSILLIGGFSLFAVLLRRKTSISSIFISIIVVSIVISYIV